MTTNGTHPTIERKIIDLDALIPETQYVRLDGKEHEILPPSVDMYLQVMKRRGRMKNADTELEQIEQAIELICLACPTIPRERLIKLPMRALTAMTDIIEEQMSDEVEDGGNLTLEATSSSGE